MAFAARSWWGFAAVSLSVPALAGADTPPIQDIAPADSFLVLSVPNWPAAKTAFMRSPGGQLWQDKAMQEWLEKIWKDLREDATPEASEMMNELRERFETIGEPTGAIGGAWRLAKAPKAEDAAEDAEPGMISHMLLVADFGDNAEKAEAEIVAYLEDAAKKDRLTIAPISVAGIDGHEIELKIELDEEDQADPDVDGGMDEMDGMEDFDDLGGPEFSDLLGGGTEGPIKLFLARSGGAIVLASQKDGLEHALDRLAGANRPHLADNADFEAALAQHPRGGHVFAAVLLNDSVRELIRGAGGGMGAMLPLPVDEMGFGFDKILGTLGLAPVKALSIAARLDAEVGGQPAMEQTFGVLLPEKKGLFALLDGEGVAFEPPAWIGADVAGVGRFNLRFERIVPLLEDIVKSLPPDLQDFASGGVQFVKTSFGPALEAMGPELYMVDTVTRPLSAKSEASVVGVKVRDELTVANAISGLAAQAGMEPRDFQGAQIYDAPDGSLSVGLGFGWLFSGDGPGVENAMRRAANPGEAGQSLASSERFRRAVAAANTTGPGLVQSWTDDNQTIEYGIWQAQNPTAMMRAEWEALGMEPAEIDEIMQGVEEELPMWVKDMPSADLFRKYADCSAFSMRSTPDGFRATYVTLPPRQP